MTFLEALFGSQYEEIHKQGKDGNKGRSNANLFLAALILLLIIAILMIGVSFVPGFNNSLTGSVQDVFGNSSGNSIGKLLALPAFIIIYLAINFSVGNQQNFTLKVEAFMQYPEEVRKKANARLIIPFFVLLGFVIVLALLKL
jgi:hypothetical protein